MKELKDIDLLELQTKFMKQDPTTKALCAALTPQLRQVASEVRLCLIYSLIDELPEPVLDELAWQMKIDWYDATVAIEIKRKLIKTAPAIKRCLGTPYAVEEVIKIYFGDGELKEWFDYGGVRGKYKVITSNTSVTGELAQQFIRVIESVKRKSSHLEEIIISLSGEMNLYYAGVVHTGDFLEIRQVI
ncbi:MAG TPA: phage tail protein I [Clostridia bacterium]|nr:phage tail protein I [Clostridia bacterium]